ncbi:MAG: NAD(P)-dependent oxidoreductase [Clostridium sp.]|uniref:NAD-dependent epimerase/dehydratase family protein n=1 Tax=Clostridium sp. TaxID=1506 RepID=UPI0025C6AB62|nr:NAD(P)-dependent oxidoreductase [Clostridium sp.]MCF0147284.1 NAD(P)-dependent oxidoreductase [Clostridium sp.]
MIAITGGTGFIGQWILKLYSDKYKFKVLTRSLDMSKDIYKHENIEYCVTDYSEDSLKKELKGCNGVIHLASIRFDKNQKEKFTRYLDNIVLTENLFDVCNELNIKNIVFLSSRAVYGNSEETVNIEEQKFNPMNLYGVSKATIELISEYYNDKYDMKIKSLRVSQVLGLGEREGYMFSIFLNSCLNKKTIYLYGEGKGERNYIYVKDLARAIIMSLEKNDFRGSYNIAGNRTISNSELAETMCKVFDNNNNIAYLKDKVEDLSIQKINIDKAKKDLGFECVYELIDMMEDIKRTLEEENSKWEY